MSGGTLISGATTPLGIALCERMLERGPVLATGIEPPEQAARLLPEGTTYVPVDLTRPRFVRRLLFGPVRDLGISRIVHLPGHRDPTTAGRRAHRLMVDSTRLMLRLADHHPTIERFILRSSVYVYRNRTDQADVLREDAQLELSPGVPQFVRDQVEADITVCGRMGMSSCTVAVLRCAEVLAPDMGSQLYDYLSSRVCFRPVGFDPMLDLLSLPDAVRALGLAADSDAEGIFNIPGADVLPLSRAIRLWGRSDMPLPGPLVGPAYNLRQAVRGASFNYGLNRWRWHFSTVLDGGRAERVLGYVPGHPIDWPARSPT